MKKEVNIKIVIGIILLFVFLGGLFSFSIYNEYNSIKTVNVDELSSGNISFKVESVENSSKNKIVSIKGWAFKKNQNLSLVKTYITLKNKSTSQVFKINTVKEERNDVTLSLNDSYNYNHSGFFANFNKNQLKDKGEYEICILYLSDNNNYFVPTGKFLEIN